jgi:hypothetical protein
MFVRQIEFDVLPVAPSRNGRPRLEPALPRLADRALSRDAFDRSPEAQASRVVLEAWDGSSMNHGRRSSGLHLVEELEKLGADAGVPMTTWRSRLRSRIRP